MDVDSQRKFIRRDLRGVLLRPPDQGRIIQGSTGDCSYVYFHESNNEIVYIGSGTTTRAWSIYHRQKDHASWILDQINLGNRNNYVEIHEDFLSKEDAIALEYELIGELNPRFNKQGRKKDVISELSGTPGLFNNV